VDGKTSRSQGRSQGSEGILDKRFQQDYECRSPPKLAKVCIEELMIAVIAQTFCKEVVTWKSLHHPNVLSLLGVTMGERLFAMISEWMVNGNIVDFVEAHRDANRFKLVGSRSHTDSTHR